ncbi:hypothetical protein MNEG_7980, partial [Monoraphidium neglectum]
MLPFSLSRTRAYNDRVKNLTAALGAEATRSSQAQPWHGRRREPGLDETQLLSERSVEAFLREPLAGLLARSSAPETGPTPVGREEALALEARLARLLPPGAALALQARHSAAAEQHAPGAPPRQRPGALMGNAAGSFVACACKEEGGKDTGDTARRQERQQQALPEAASPLLLAAFSALDALLRDAANQVPVAVGCAERGRVLEGLRLRYAELLNAMALALGCCERRSFGLQASLDAARAAALTAEGRAAAAAAAAADARREAEGVAEAAEAAGAEGEARAEGGERAAAALRRRVQALEEAAEQLEQQLSAERADTERQLLGQRAEAEAALAAAEARADDLLERLRFAERQAGHYRDKLGAALTARRPPGRDADSQTDPLPAPPPAPRPTSRRPAALQHALEEVADAVEGAEETDEDVEPQATPFAALLRRAAASKATRSRQWTVKTAGLLFADKAAADAAADAAGARRAQLGPFFLDWHMHR